MNVEWITLPRRKQTRLQAYDYAQEGSYFISICAAERRCLFGDISEGEMRLNSVGEIAAVCWYQIPRHFPGIELGEYVIMPNHMHGILTTAVRMDKTGNPPNSNPSISTIVGRFKGAVTKQVRAIQGHEHMRVWQRGFYEHVIRTERALARMRQYICDNPVKWDLDEDNLERRTRGRR